MAAPPSRPLEENIVQVDDLVEKPAQNEAPSNLAVMGSYVFGPEIFEVLAETKPGRGGEIQLTDAIKSLGEHEPVYGWTFRERSFRRRQQARLPRGHGGAGPGAGGHRPGVPPVPG